MATHCSTIAWKIPWMEEPGGLPSVGSHRGGQAEVTQQQQQPSTSEKINKMSCIHTMEYYLANIMLNTRSHSPKKHILNDCIYRHYPEQSNLYRQRVEQWCLKLEPGVRRRRGGLLRGPVQFQGQQQCSHIGCGDHSSIRPPFLIEKRKNPEVYVCIKRVNYIVCAFLSVVLQPIT